jgi:tetratricopeptide (TPR) repeat protein
MPTTDSNTNLDLHAATYIKAVEQFGQAVDQLNQNDHSGAKKIFNELIDWLVDEPVMTARAKTYIKICDQQLSPELAAPSTIEEKYRQGVFKSNAGECDEALRIFDEIIQASPSTATYIYARASAHALKGNAEAAINDLRRAISFDAQIRFQAVNDSDFEGIREEPAFIDIIEPTSSGV